MSRVISNKTRRNKPNCLKTQVPCSTDVDCQILCNVVPTMGNIGSNVITYECDDNSGLCKSVKVTRQYHDLAIQDFRRIRRERKSNSHASSKSIFDRLPSNAKNFISHAGGSRFVAQRALFYESVADKLSRLNDKEFEEEIKRIERELLKKERNRVSNALLKMERDAQSLSKYDECGTSLSHQLVYLKQMVANTRRLLFSLDQMIRERGGVVITDQKYSWEEVRRYASGGTQESLLSAYSSEKGETPNDVWIQVRDFNWREKGYRKSMSEWRCNEEMGAGMLLALFENAQDPSKKVALCSCNYPWLLTGPACEHRTYEYAVDYEQWEKDGDSPTFLKKVGDFTSAQPLCQKLQPNSYAKYDDRDRFFRCPPLAERIGETTTKVSATYPPEIFDAEYCRLAFDKKTSGVRLNYEYIDLLGVLEGLYNKPPTRSR